MASALFQNEYLKSFNPKRNQEAVKSCSQRQASDQIVNEKSNSDQISEQLLDWVDQCEYICREPKCKFRHKHRQTFIYHLKTRHELTPDTFIEAWNGLAATEKMQELSRTATGTPGGSQRNDERRAEGMPRAC